MRIPMVSRLILPVLLVFVLASSARAQLVETEIPGISAELVELRQQAGVLRFAVRLVNASAKDVATDALYLSQFVLVDAKSKTKHFVMKGADGNFLGGPTVDWNSGGRWGGNIPPKSQMILWALFEPLPSGSTVSVQIPKMFPFDDIKVSEGVGKLLSSTAMASDMSNAAAATLVSARRADQQLTIRLRLVAGTAVSYAPTILYEDVYFFDPLTKRKYPVVKDNDGNFQAQPISDHGSGGRLGLSGMRPQAVALMSLTLQAPPDTVVAGDLIVPGFLPIEGLAIAGSGGAAAGGVAASGRSLGLESALKELNANVTAAEIAINLSADVLFDFDKADLKPTAEQSLQRLLTVVNEKATSAVSVVGHTDIRGDAAYNMTLSTRRATAVKTWLVAHGVQGNRITASGAGESRPLKAGDTEEAHRANRRVEISIKG